MAFPTIVDADTKSGTQASNSTSWTLTYPTNIAAGDLLLAFVSLDGTGVVTFPAGWVAGGLSSGANELYCAKKKAVGTETGTFSLTTPSEQGGWRIFRITAATWEGTIGTDFSTAPGAVTDNGNGQTAVSSGPVALNIAWNSGAATWGSVDVLVIEALSIDTSRTINAYPTDMPDHHSADVSGGAGGATLAVASKNITGTGTPGSPAAWTISASDDWVINTLAVRPAAGGSVDDTITAPAASATGAAPAPVVAVAVAPGAATATASRPVPTPATAVAAAAAAATASTPAPTLAVGATSPAANATASAAAVLPQISVAALPASATAASVAATPQISVAAPAATATAVAPPAEHPKDVTIAARAARGIASG